MARLPQLLCRFPCDKSPKQIGQRPLVEDVRGLGDGIFIESSVTSKVSSKFSDDGWKELDEADSEIGLSDVCDDDTLARVLYPCLLIVPSAYSKDDEESFETKESVL